MSKGPSTDESLDEGAYRDADAHFRVVSERLPEAALEAVAREVVKRLAFRLPQQSVNEGHPTAEEILALYNALLSDDETAADAIILNARRDGVGTERIYLSYVAGAARMLGKSWEEDLITFVEVAMASGRLYRIIRGLRHLIDRAAIDALPERHVLFALVPHETHTLGIEMATDLFRQRGWDVDLSVGESHDDVVRRSEMSRFSAIVLIANSERRVADLIALVLSLRITQPLAQIVVAGNIVGQVPDIDTLVSADAVLPDIETAVHTLGSMIGDSD